MGSAPRRSSRPSRTPTPSASSPASGRTATRPRTPGRRAALERCVFYDLQFQRGVNALTQALDDQIAGARIIFDRHQQDQVAEHTATLADDPAAAFGRLSDLAAGCRWLIGEWEELRAALNEEGCWFAATHRDRAIRLLGLRPEDAHQEKVFWLTLINLCAGPEPDARRPVVVPGQGEHPRHAPAGARERAAGRERCVQELRARVDDELAVLRGREEYLRLTVEEPSRDGAPRRSLVLAGEEGQRMDRYFQMNDTAFNRNLKVLTRKEGEGVVEEAEEPGISDPKQALLEAVIVGENAKVELYRMEAAEQAQGARDVGAEQSQCPRDGRRRTKPIAPDAPPNKAKCPAAAAPNKAKYPVSTELIDPVYESSADWDPELSPLVAMAKSLKIDAARREAETFANPRSGRFGRGWAGRGRGSRPESDGGG